MQVSSPLPPSTTPRIVVSPRFADGVGSRRADPLQTQIFGIVGAEKFKKVDAGAAVERIVAKSAEPLIVADPTTEHIIEVAAAKDVIAIIAVENYRAC